MGIWFLRVCSWIVMQVQPYSAKTPYGDGLPQSQVLGLLRTNRHVEAGVLVCEHTRSSPPTPQHTQALTHRSRVRGLGTSTRMNLFEHPAVGGK